MEPSTFTPSVISPGRSDNVGQPADAESRTPNSAAGKPCVKHAAAREAGGVRDDRQQLAVSMTHVDKHTNDHFICGDYVDDGVSVEPRVEFAVEYEKESCPWQRNSDDNTMYGSSTSNEGVDDKSGVEQQGVQREVSFASCHSDSSSSGFASDSVGFSGSSSSSFESSNNTASDSSITAVSRVKTPLSDRKTLRAKRHINKTAGALKTPFPAGVNLVAEVAGNLSVLQCYVPMCLERYGFCVVDNFLGGDLSQAIAAEVHSHYERGVFVDGQLTNKRFSSKGVRGDQVFWLEDENDSRFVNVRRLLTMCDNVFKKLSGRLKPYAITSRTKAMMACYPDKGRGYRQHIDNPDEDGRCITCIYYLNADWNTETDGGVLRLCPTTLREKSIDLEPQLDRLLLFWSDHRTPHEVLPAFRKRYAVTIWYFDDEERRKARERFAQQEGREEKEEESKTPNQVDRALID